MKKEICLTVNGNSYEMRVEPHVTLVEVLRDRIGLTGTKSSCGTGHCGACTVLVDDEPILSCLTLAMNARDKKVITIEGLSNGNNLHLLQKTFIEYGAIQCGYCTPGMILSAKALLDKNPEPTREEVMVGLSGNLCRCTGYVKIGDAVMAAANEIREGIK